MKRNKTKHRTRGAGTLVWHGNAWHARWKVNGKLVSRSTGTDDRSKAEEWLERQSVVRTGMRDRAALSKIAVAISTSLEDGADARVVGLPIGDLFELYKSAQNRRDITESTLEGYRHQFNVFTAWMAKRYPDITSARDISQTVADEFAADRAQSVSANRLNKDLNLFSLVWRTLRQKYGLEYNPWSAEHIARHRLETHERRALTDEEVRAVLANSEGEYHLMILIALCTGLRMGDILNLRWDEQVDMRARTVAIKRTRKTGAPIALPLADDLYKALKTAYRARGGSPWCLPVLHADVARVGTPHAICRKIARIFAASGIEMHPKNEDGTRNRAPTASFHSLRHTFVTRLMRRGIAPALIQAAVGHSTMMMTEHYTHISAEDLARGLSEN